MSSSGSSGTNSVSNFGNTLVLNVAILGVFVLLFLIFRPKQKRIYQPRSTVDTVAYAQRPRPLKKGPVGWFTDLVTRKEAEVLQDAGLDGYFFLRYLRMAFIIAIVGVLFVCPVLIPINATGGNGNDGFNMLSFQNVKNTNRYYAHVFVGWIYFGFILFTLYREVVYYIGVRHAVLTSPAYSTLVSSRTILITTVPDEYLDVEALTSIFDGVKYIWLNRNLKDLTKKVEERDKLAMKVEGAETKLLKTAVNNRLKSEKKKGGKGPVIDGEEISVYVPTKKRPTHKLKPIIGKKVDTIDYGTQHIQELNGEIAQMRANVDDSFAKLNSVFICFQTQELAETAVQTLAHHQALHMSPRTIGIRPDEIVWANLRLRWWERIVRSSVAKVLIALLVIFWTIPVAAVGSISNIKSLEEKLPWLSFLEKIPKVIYGVVSGFLPTILLAVLMAVLPIFIRAMAKLAGCPTKTLIEYWTQNAYFAFQVVQVFLVTTISSGAAAVVQEIINDPSSTMSLLANNLPKASNFYISYLMLQGFTIAGGALLQLVALILFHVLGTVLDTTPRKKWNRWNIIGATSWGTVFPVYTNLAVIGITYSVITPIMAAFSALCFGCVYFAYLHNLLFVVNPSEGRGIFYPRAIYQTFTGLYLAEVCLLGLFVVAKAWGPLVLQAVFIFVTVLVHTTMQKAFDPLLANLPRNLLAQTASTIKSSGVYGDDPTLNHSVTGGKEKVQYGQNESISSGNVGTTAAQPISSESRLAANSSAEEAGKPAGSGTKQSFFTRYFKPHVYLQPSVVQHEFLTPRFHEAPPPLPEDVESGAYANPAITAQNPVIWIPRDPWGLSQAEVAKMRASEVNAFDSGAWFEVTDKKKAILKWGNINDVPIWTPPPPY